MLESIRIANFRGIRECEIRGLADVNVFLGRNGAGKSTLLEAIYLASSWVEPVDPVRGLPKTDYVIRRRGGRGDWNTHRGVLWFMKDVEKDIEITLRFKSSAELSFKIPYEIPSTLLLSMSSPVLLELASGDALEILKSAGFSGAARLYFTPQLGWLWNPETDQCTGVGTAIREKLLTALKSELEYLRDVALLDGRILASDVEQRVWARLLDRRLDKLIVELVREEYEPSVESILYKPVGGSFALALALRDTTVELDALGDGARMAILYASPLVLAGNTAVLMEDPETHQHPGGLAALMRFALKIAQRRGLQLFISTHSIELVNILKMACEELGLKLRVFHMERDFRGVVDVRALDSVDVETLQKMGLDPRLLHVL